MSRLKWAFITLLLLAFVFTGLLVLAPAILVTPFINSTLSDLGYELTQLDGLRLGTNSARVSRVNLSNAESRISLTDLEMHFQVRELLRGRLQSLHLARLDITLLPPAGNSSQQAEQSIEGYLQMIDQIPIGDINISALHLESVSNQLQIDMAVQTNPVRIEGLVVFGTETPIKGEIQAQRTDTNRVEGSIDLAIESTPIGNSNFVITIAEPNLELTLDSTLQLAALQEFPAIGESLKAVQWFTDSVSATGSLTLITPLTAPSIADLKLTLKSPDSLLHLAQNSTSGVADLVLQLPLVISSELVSLDAGFELALTDIGATGSWQSAGESADKSADIKLSLASTLKDPRLFCSSLNNCRLTGIWESTLPAWQIGLISGTDLSLSGPVNVRYVNEGLSVGIASLAVVMPSIKSAAADSSLDLTLSAVDFTFANFASGSFAFSSNSFSPGFEAFTLTRPAISGRFELAEEAVTGLIELAVDQQLQLGAAVKYYFFRDSGDADVQLASHVFSPEQPLSSWLSQTFFDGDIVGGQISAQANVSWSRQPDQSWAIGGPVRASLENISGHYGDSFFVGLNSELFTEATTPPGIKSTMPLSATIASVDVGLPLEHIEWNYSFNSVTRQLHITDLLGQLLGGNVSIAEFDYQADRAENEVTVVLTDLNLDSIVKLANYPNVIVDGLISGTIPVVITADGVTVEKGLVGALNPGGTIRYTPTNPLPNTNASLQLVNDALSNYRYESMNTEVYYDKDGELLMEVQLRGLNPSMNDGQPINLNLSVTDNIPSLLKSLQASRVITDELEEKLRNR